MMRFATIGCLLLALCCAPTAFGELVQSVSTGFDSGTGLAIEGGLPDPDYTITPGDLTATVLLEEWPVAPGVWMANSATSKWVGFATTSSNAAAGDFDFTTSVMLEGYDPATAFLTGGWASDNNGLNILINGTSTGVTNTGGFGALSPFSNVGLGLFQQGANTITFQINNAGEGPAGLRVDAGLYASMGEQPFDFVIHNTGVNDSGVTLPDDAVDPHWTLSGTGVAEGQGPDAIVATSAGGFPIGPWLSDAADATSAWITAGPDTAGPGATDGTAIYQFSTTFSTTGDGAVTISGLQSADNQVVDVQLDGVSGTFAPIGFDAFADFSVGGDVMGTEHTLSFFVQNGSGEATPDGPIGVRVQITDAQFVPVPEPSVLAMTVAALLGLALLARRKRNV